MSTSAAAAPSAAAATLPAPPSAKEAAPSASSSPTSPGTVNTATPRLANAALTACSSRYGICEPAVTVAWNADTSANTALLSTSWKKLLPISEVGTCPQIASTGAWDFLASYNPFNRCNEPGPTVPMHTPRVPLS